MPNTAIPAIPQPTGDPQSHGLALSAVKQALDSLAGRRGNPLGQAATHADLVALGLVTQPQLASALGGKGGTAAMSAQSLASQVVAQEFDLDGGTY